MAEVLNESKKFKVSISCNGVIIAEMQDNEFAGQVLKSMIEKSDYDKLKHLYPDKVKAPQIYG